MCVGKKYGHVRRYGHARTYVHVRTYGRVCTYGRVLPVAGDVHGWEEWRFRAAGAFTARSRTYELTHTSSSVQAHTTVRFPV